MGLWLAAAFLIPSAIATPEITFSYVQLPRVVLLRTLASLIAMFWPLEWLLASRSDDFSLPAISWVVLVKDVNRVQADIYASQAFRGEDIVESVALIDKAVSLTPDSAIYFDKRGTC